MSLRVMFPPSGMTLGAKGEHAWVGETVFHFAPRLYPADLPVHVIMIILFFCLSCPPDTVLPRKYVVTTAVAEHGLKSLFAGLAEFYLTTPF